MADSAPNDDAAAPAGMASRIDQVGCLKALNSLFSLCLYGRALYRRVISQYKCNLCDIRFGVTQINETAQGVQAVGGYVRLKREIRPCSREGYAEHHYIGILRLLRER